MRQMQFCVSHIQDLETQKTQHETTIHLLKTENLALSSKLNEALEELASTNVTLKEYAEKDERLGEMVTRLSQIQASNTSLKEALDEGFFFVLLLPSPQAT